MTRGQGVRSWWLARSTGDILVLMIAGTVCFSILAAGLAVVVIELVRPETSTAQVINTVGDVINTLIGLLAGFLAGRTDALHEHRRAVERAEEQRHKALGDSS